MFKQVAGAVISIIAFTFTGAGQATKHLGANNHADARWEESLGGAEAGGALARFGDLSPTAIRECLRRTRLPAYLPGSYLVNKIIEAQHLRFAKSKRVYQLKGTLQPLLNYHERGKMPFVVLRSEQPKAYLVERTAIIITTRMMVIANDEEIRGIIAHELAHEYVWDERVKAMKEKDKKLMRELELFCDAVAAFTLKEIGDDPESYGRIVERITMIGNIHGSVNSVEYIHHLVRQS